MRAKISSSENSTRTVVRTVTPVTPVSVEYGLILMPMGIQYRISVPELPTVELRAQEIQGNGSRRYPLWIL